uniref:SPARC-like 2 n=1 Tax=Poecilia reticulata TaxID=8081 RepID=A0A3P9NXQ6_POERE
GGRALRRQREAEERLTPYIGRVDPKLCELLRCHSPVGSWCQVVQEKGILTPKRVCPQSCPQRAPVCSVLGKTYGNKCLLHKEACRKRRRTGVAHSGPCLLKSECTEDELGQFPYRLLDWFLLLRRMRESYTPAALPQTCLSHGERTQLAQLYFTGQEQRWKVEQEGSEEAVLQEDAFGALRCTVLLLSRQEQESHCERVDSLPGGSFRGLVLSFH